jgi:hypothetical protein
VVKLFDFDHPFFKPLWVRVAVVAFAGGWGVFEFLSGSPFWGVLFLAIAAVAFHGLFIAFNPRDDVEKTEGKD